MWQRTGAVRLFLEHVTLFAEKDEDVSSENVVRLWKVGWSWEIQNGNKQLEIEIYYNYECSLLKVLGDETDFSSLRSLEAIEKLLLNYSEDVKHR